MDITQVPVDVWIVLATVIASLIVGELTKKFTKIESKKIPLQNMLIGLIVCGIEWAITKDFNGAILISGIASGGVYDLGKALKQVLVLEEK